MEAFALTPADSPRRGLFGAAPMTRDASDDSGRNDSGRDDCVRRAAAGDVRAFETLYRDNIGRVFALCLRMSGNPREAEELAQDAFVRAWEKIDTFDGRSAFSTWLHRLTVNVVLGEWRRRGRRREKEFSLEDLEAPEEMLEAPPSRSPQRAIDLERAIAELPRGARTVFVLYSLEGYQHQEIAELTGLAVGTCKAQLHRARALLRKALET